MKIKKWMAGLLACVFMAMNLSAVCFAAGPDVQVPTETKAADTAGTETEGKDGETDVAPIAEQDTEETSGSTDGNKVTGGSGTVCLPFDSMEELKEALAGADGGDNDDTETVTTGRVNVSPSSYLHLRDGSGMDKAIIGHLFQGDELEITGEDGDWYQVTVKERTGYVYKDYVDVVEQAVSEGGETDGDMMKLLMYLLMSTQSNNGNSSAALTPDGNLTLVDDYSEKYADGSGKQFITVTTKDGNYFYLVIDRDEDGDENVHFMNLVDEADLLALMDEDEAAKYTQPAPTEPAEPDEAEPAEPEEKEPEETPKKKVDVIPALILILALLGGGGFFAFTKLKGKQKKQQQEKPDPDADYVDGEDEIDFDLPDDVGEEDDDSTMFDAEDDEPV